MANPFEAVGNFFSDVGKAVSEGLSNLTGGNGNKGGNTPSSPLTNNSNNNTSNKKAQNTPTPPPSSTPKHGSSNSNTNNRSNSAGAQALQQQISSTTPSSNNSPSGGSSSPKPTISAVPDTPIVGTPTIMVGDNKGQALTPDMITSEKPSTGGIVNGSTSEGNNVVLGGFTGIVNNVAGNEGGFKESMTEIFENKEQSSKPFGGITPDNINYGVVNMGGLVGVNPSVDELNQPVPQTSVNTDNMVGLGGKPTLSLLPNNYNPLKVQSTISTLPDGSTWQIGVSDDGKATVRNMDKTVGVGTDLIYRDPSMVGIHTFDSKAEAEAFLEQLYPDGNYNWTDTSTPWYDSKTGEFIGYLGEEAYPYAIAVPETYDAPIRLEFNTGGIKGNSPSAGSGKSSWTDVPSAKTRAELRNAGFDYGFSSRDLDYAELVTQNERRGYDESWYDGMVGQNTTPYDAEKGAYDARTSNISIADVKSGKVDYATLSGVQGGKDILNADAAVRNYIETKLTPEESADIYMQSLETGKPRFGLEYVKPDRQNIVDLYAWTDAMEKGAEKRDNKFWFDNSWLVSPVVRGLNDIGDKINEFNADFRQGKMPILDTIVEYAPQTPFVGGLGVSAGKYLSDTVLGKNNTASSDDLFTPKRQTSWLLSLGSGVAQAPMGILSMPENVLGAAEEIGYDKVGKVGASAGLGLINTVVTDYQNNPDYALYDLAGLALPVAGMVGKIGKSGKMTTNVDGVDIEFGKSDISVDDAIKELRERQQFEKEVAKAEKEVEKQAKKEAKSGNRQYSPTYSNLRDITEDMVVNNIRNYNIRNPSTVANVNALDFRDEMTGVSLFKDDSLSKPALNLRDRDSTLPILRDRDSTLPILRDRNSNLPIFRDKDSGNKALIVRDRDGALAVRSKDKQMPYVPKDRDVPPVHRTKDNKILPFLDELGDLFGGSGDGGLTGGTYWGRGRGRSWRVENKDIADASQFSGLF